MPSVPWPRPEGRARHVPWPSGVGCGGGPARDHVPDRPARESLAAQVAEEDVLFVPLVVLPPRVWAAGWGGGRANRLARLRHAGLAPPPRLRMGDGGRKRPAPQRSETGQPMGRPARKEASPSGRLRAAAAR